MKKYIAFVVILIAAVSGFYWWSTRGPVDQTIVTSKGLHWHPVLTIYAKGVQQFIPANIGIGPEFAVYPSNMAPMHTHDDAPSGIIHLEFEGVVHKDDLKLGQFFKNWGKDINSFGSNMKMTVNGVENTDYGNYVMHDGDKIVLRYE